MGLCALLGRGFARYGVRVIHAVRIVKDAVKDERANDDGSKVRLDTHGASLSDSPLMAFKGLSLVCLIARRSIKLA